MTSVNGVGSVVSTAEVEASSAQGMDWNASPGIPRPSLTFADPVAAALASMADFAGKIGETQRELRKAKVELRKQFERQQVEAMRERADEIEKGAIVAGLMLAGSATLYGVAAAHKKDSTTERYCSPGGELMSKGSDVATRGFEAAGTRMEADEKEAELAARAADDEVRSHEDDARAAAEIVTKAMDAIRSVHQAKHAAESAAATVRG